MTSHESLVQIPFASFDVPSHAVDVSSVAGQRDRELVPLRAADRADHHGSRTRPTEQVADAHQESGCAVGPTEEAGTAGTGRRIVTDPVLDVVLVHAGLHENLSVPVHRAGIGERARWLEFDVALPLEDLAALVKPSGEATRVDIA